VGAARRHRPVDQLPDQRAGIHVHQTERGYHNYAEPYSWDVRLGHKTRDEALDELDDETPGRGRPMLAEIGYVPKRPEVLTAWYRLPAIRCVAPRVGHRLSWRPKVPTEATIADTWASVLRLDRVGADDDFFDLGGTSLDAIEMIVTLSNTLGVRIPEGRAFRHRTVRSLAVEVEAVVAEAGGAADGTSAIGTAHVPSRAVGPAPVSAGQTALLYEYRVRHDEPVYNVVHQYRIGPVDGKPVDVDRLRAAIITVVARHEPLHTLFDGARTVLPAERSVRVDLADRHDAAAFDALAAREATRRFDLERGPLVRATIVSLVDEDTGDDEHTGLVLAVHHVSSDAASLANLWRDLDRAYAGEALPALPYRYSDHAEWQRSRVTAVDLAAWVEHLGDDPVPVELPVRQPVDGRPGGTGVADRVGSADGGDEGAVARPRDGYVTRPIDVTAAVLHDAGMRPMPFFLATFAALLQRYTDTDDVVIGTVASTRDHPDVAEHVGYFLNVLPLRLTVDPESTPRATVADADAVLGDALGRRHVPYADIAAELRRRGARHPDPARVMFVFDEVHRPTLAGVPIDARIVHPGAAVAELTVFVRPTGDGFETSVEWSGTAWHDVDVDTLAAEFARMAQWAAARPTSPWLDQPLAGELCGAPITEPLRPIVTTIAEHAERTPAAPAVRCGDTQLTYAQLVEQARRVAAALRAAGVERGDRVAVCLPRSTELLATVVGIQWLGAAYVPIDTSYPPARVDLLADAARPKVTITAETPLPLCADPGPERPVAELDDPAYVIFTSGSTGRPRGVVVDQRRLAASTFARLDHYATTDAPATTDERSRPERSQPRRSRPERFLVVSSVGFDSSIAGLYWTLLAGGEVVLPTESDAHDVDALGALIDTANVTHTLMVPTLYGAVLHRAVAQDGGCLTSLQVAIVAGEACPAALVEQHHARLAGCELWNEYGPTETTVWATAHRCLPGDDPVPIGRPVPGATARVADRWLRPRPDGASGELVVGGSGVTDGYLDDADRTAAAFVTMRDGRRAYRTGDLTRTDAGDGTAPVIEFLGRVDHQLSLGGARLEPEEIEAALTAVDGIAAAIVRVERELDRDPFEVLGALDPDVASTLLRDAADADDPPAALLARLAEHTSAIDVLVAHCEVDATGAAPFDATAIASTLRKRLPAAMVPRRFVPVDALPRTEHDKIDRAGLGPAVHAPPGSASGPSAPSPTRPGASAQGLESDTRLLAALVDAWRASLGRDDVDADSDFFDAGGDSLRAVHLVTVLEEQLGQRVPISALVLGRTPRRLAGLLVAPSSAAPSVDRDAGDAVPGDGVSCDDARPPTAAATPAPGPTTPAVSTTSTAARRQSFAVPLQLPAPTVSTASTTGNRGADPTTATLFVFPPGGGNLVVFDDFVAALDPAVAVYGFDLPGADRDDELPTSIEALCETYLSELRRIQPHGPYHLFGWSFGGVAALELARRLHDAGHDVGLVTMVDTLVPGYQRAGRARLYLDMARRGDVRALAARASEMVRWRVKLWAARRRGERAAASGQRLDAVDRDAWVTMRIDELVERHRPSRYDGPVLYFSAQDSIGSRTTGPWSELLADLDVIELDGSHAGDTGLLRGPRARTVADEISRRLRQTADPT
jgi:amino acid adenylation domain-containing protein